MFYNALVKFRDEQLENYQGQPLEYSASDYHHISKPGAKVVRGRTQAVGSSAKRTQASIAKDLHRRLGTQEPKSSASVESYDPFRSPKHKGTAAEAKYAQITVHHAVPEAAEHGEVSPVVRPPPSIMEEDEPDDENDVEDSPFTVLQKRKHKPASMKSFQSSRFPHSSSRARGFSTRSMSRRNVSFHHARNRSHGSNKTKRRKTGALSSQTDLKRSPSAASLQMLADGVVPDIPSSPPLPAQPTVVRPHAGRSRPTDSTRRVLYSDMIWKEDARKVSNELSLICEEAFNGSSVTMRTASTSTEVGYETPATPISISSPARADTSSSVPKTKAFPPRESSRSWSIQELTETRRKLVEHSTGRNDNIPGYLSGVIGHLDRLIEEDQAQHRTRGLGENEPQFVDPFVTTTKDAVLPAISEEFAASPIRAPEELSPKRKTKSRTSTRHGDNKATIRMVPQSSLRSMEEVKPLMIRKKNQVPELDSAAHMNPIRAFSASSRMSRHTTDLDPIEENPGSPKKEKSHDHKKWSWFKHRSQISDPSLAIPKEAVKDKSDTQTITPSAGTVIVHAPQDLQSPIQPQQERPPVRKTSMERFGGALKKLIPKKSTKTVPQQGTGMFNSFNCMTTQLRPFQGNTNSKDLQDTPTQGIEPDSSYEADDRANPFGNKRRSIASQNWFARVFQIKPACRVMALNTTKAKGRKEVYKLLRDWEDYGMEDVKLDKANSIVYGRVGEVNCKCTSNNI